MNNEILNLFGKAIITNSKIDFSNLNKIAVTNGYLVHPDVCNQDVVDWLSKKATNYNSTFYSSWNNIISKNRFELYIDQLLHYSSTYGTNYEGIPYIPNEGSDVPSFTTFKTILPISQSEVVERCCQMLYSGIALKQETITSIFTIIDGLSSVDLIDINKVKNKEAKMFLYRKLNLVPHEPSEMVRYLIYLSTGKFLLIKDKETIEGIKNSRFNINKYIFMFGAEELSSIFHRFKPLFLAFKSNKKNCKIINQLRKLANKNHVPYKFGFFEKLISNYQDVIDLNFQLGKTNNFNKIKLLQAISIKKKSLSIRAFGIRNQKLFIKENPKGFINDEKMITYLNRIYGIIHASLISSMKLKACKIKMPIGINLTLPTSEKSFIGNFPLGTSFDFSDTDNIVGINWRSEEGAEDLDLKLIDINGEQYGWNANYTNSNNSIIFSGDMTSAHPDATELFYTKKGFNPSIVKINLYNGVVGSKFKFFIAKEKIIEMDTNYMVNPNNIIFEVDSVMDSKEKQVGVITENKFILAQFRTGRGKVASGDTITNKYTDYALNTLDCYLSLDTVLSEAGFEFVDNDAAIDLTDLSKDTLINLFR